MIALIVAAVAVGVVGHLCWRKFAGPVGVHLQLLSLQKDTTVPAGTAIIRPLQSGLRVHRPIAEQLLQDKCEILTQSRNSGNAFYYGPVGSGASRRFVFLALSRTESSPVSSVTLVVRTFTVASLLSPLRETGDAQILPFFTYRGQFRIDAPAISTLNPRVLVLTGTSDQTPFRYELLFDANDRVSLIRDEAPAARSAAERGR